jgi:hypothetical protein
MNIMGFKELDIDRYLFFFIFEYYDLFVIINCAHTYSSSLQSHFYLRSRLWSTFLDDREFFFLNKMTSSSRYLRIYIEIKKFLSVILTVDSQ